MDQGTNRGFGLWRGALGGLVGGILGISILHALRGDSAKAAISYWALLGMMKVVPLTVLGGPLVGALVATLCRYLRAGILKSLLTAVGLAAAVGGVLGAAAGYLIADDGEAGAYVTFFLEYGLIVGATVGLLVGACDYKPRDSRNRGLTQTRIPGSGMRRARVEADQATSTE